MSTRFAKALPRIFLGKNAANDRITQFRNAKHLLLSDALGGGRMDTESVWYSIDDFEELYKELIYLNANGVRIYFGEYENNHPSSPNQLCLIFVPTRLNNSPSSKEDILLEEEPDFLQRIPRINALPQTVDHPEKLLSKAYNYGSPCPPICPIDGDIKYPFPIEEI